MMEDRVINFWNGNHPLSEALTNLEEWTRRYVRDAMVVALRMAKKKMRCGVTNAMAIAT